MDLLSTAAFQRHHGQQLQLAFKLANATAAASAKLSSGVDALRDDYAQLEDEASEISVVRRVRELMRAYRRSRALRALWRSSRALN
jgi:hypothetical protein